jgi:hypothetical protein
MQRLRQRLAADPAVSSVEVNHRSGSVLVTGEHTADLHSALSTMLDIVETIARTEQPSDQAVNAVVNAVKAADEGLRRHTDGRLSVRWLIPAAFVSLGVRELLRQGLTLGAVPWYVLIYYGVDSFMKLYPEHSPQPSWDRPDLRVVKAEE